jgi:hypothetical protein
MSDEHGSTSGPVVDPGDRDGGGSGDDEEGYVHQPRSSPPSRAPTGEGEFDWRGWLLVAVIVFAFFVVPVAILFLPEAQSFIGTLGLTLRDAYLVLPLVPAFLLATVAVWAAVRSRS